MSQYVTDTRVKKGQLAISGVPFEDDQDVRVIVIPRADLQKMAYRHAQELTQSIPGEVADDVVADRERE